MTDFTVLVGGHCIKSPIGRWTLLTGLLSGWLFSFEHLLADSRVSPYEDSFRLLHTQPLNEDNHLLNVSDWEMKGLHCEHCSRLITRSIPRGL